MDIVVFRPHELPIGLGALRSIEPAPSLEQDRYLELIARLHGASIRQVRNVERRVDVVRASRGIGDGHAVQELCGHPLALIGRCSTLPTGPEVTHERRSNMRRKVSLATAFDITRLFLGLELQPH